MEFKNYSANCMKYRFWFSEFRTALELMRDGKSPEEIRKLGRTENVFGATSENRKKDITNTLLNRIQIVDDSFLTLFFESNLETQRYLCLLACISVDRLMFEFVFEVFRVKLLDGFDYFTQSDINRFFDSKTLQSERIASWKDETIKKLGSVYTTMLREAGFLQKSDKEYTIHPANISGEAKRWSLANGYGSVFESLTGEKL